MQQVIIRKVGKDGWDKVTMGPIDSKKFTKKDRDWIDCMVRNKSEGVVVDNTIYEIVNVKNFTS
jgi:hypothetical protein